MPDDSALVPLEEGHVVRLGEARPQGTIELATSMANALADIVEKKKLFTVISGKKFPQVEAWMTIARMDNVVAREMRDGVTLLDDGSFEAQVELIRLSDGLVIGHGSALCGTPGDRPWDSRPMPQRRSMAVTRATSRAFRQQYSWIMALAGYEPTPAEEMPDSRREPAPDHADGRNGASTAAEQRTTHRDGLMGKAIAQGMQDFELHQTPTGFALPFRIKEGRLSQIVVAEGELALQLYDLKDVTLNQRVTVWGHYTDESYDKGAETITYKVLHAERVQTPSGLRPSVSPLREFAEEEGIQGIAPAPGQEVLSLDDEERALVGGAP
jgi:hypothetical protein